MQYFAYFFRTKSQWIFISKNCKWVNVQIRFEKGFDPIVKGLKIVQNVNKSFHQDIEEGLIEVILVNETFYPSVNITLQFTLIESQGGQKVLIFIYS